MITPPITTCWMPNLHLWCQHPMAGCSRHALDHRDHGLCARCDAHSPAPTDPLGVNEDTRVIMVIYLGYNDEIQ
jgi:hypothetical protein